jgi:autotransporter-associated beta strand repeat
MNRIHHLVWNRALGVMQVVSELANGTAGGGTRTTVRRRLHRSPLALACASVLGISSVLAAMPASAANVVIPTTTTPSDLTVDTSGPGNISQTGPVTVGGTTSLTAGGTITLTNASNDFTGAVSATGSNIDLTNSNALVLGTFNIAGNTALTAGGTITQTGALSTSSLSGSAVGDVTLSNAGNAIATLGSFSAANFSLNNAQALTVNGPLTTTGGTGNISLTTTSGALTVNTALAGSAVSLAGATGIMLNNNVSTSGGQTYSDAVTLGADTTLVSSGNGTINFISTIDGAHKLSVSTGGATTFGGAVGSTAPLTGLTTNSGTFSAGDLTVNGPLSVTTTAGGITQTSGIFTVSGTSTFNAGSNAITLTALNAFVGTVNLTGGTTQITNSGNLTLGTLNTGALTVVSAGGALNLGSGSVTGTLMATSNNLLSEGSSGLSVTGLASFTQNGGGADINLSQANNFQGGVTISGAAINNLSLKNTAASPGALTLPGSVAGNLTLNYTNAALTLPVVGVGGALDATAGGGITSNGNVSTGGAQAYHSAVTLGADAIFASTGNGNIGFDSTVNGAYALTVNTGGATSFGGAIGSTVMLTSLTTNAGGSTTLGSNVTTSGAQTYNDVVTLGGDAILASTGGGNIHLASTVDGAHKLSVSTGGAATFDGAVGSTAPLTSLTANSGTFSAASTLRIGSGGLSVTTSGGGIAQSSAFTVAGVSNFNAGTNAITLTNAGNSFTGAVSLTNSGLNNVALINGGLLTLGNVAMGSGTLSLTGNGIAQSAGTAVTQAPLAGAATLDAGTGALTLDNANNDFTGAVDATGTGITLYDGGNLTLSSLSNGANGAVDLQAAGTLSLPTTAIATGTSNLHLSSGAALTTPGDLSGANVSLSGGAGITLANNVNTGGTLTLASSSGAISNAAGMLTVGTLTGHSTGATTLTGPNQIGSLDAFTANGFSLANAQALTVIGAVSGGTGATTLTTGAGSDLDVTATGSINGGAVSLAAGGGMSLASNVSGTTVDLSASGTMLLTGTIASTGGTTVQAGKLEVGDATHPGASVTGNVVVNSGATLGGHGTIGGDVALASGAHLAPGGSIGTLTIGGNAAFAQGGVLDYEFGAPGANFQTAGSGDSVKVGGNLSLNGAVLNVTDAGGFGPGLYNLFTYGGTLTETNGGIALGTTPAGDTLLVQNLTADKQINLLNTTGMTLNLWNGNGLASATQMGGGNGTWTTTSPNWTDATGSVSAAMQPQPGFAIFGGATAGTVTLDNSTGAVSATGMQFASNGYILTGGTLNLIGSGAAPIIRVGDGSSAGAGYIATVNNVIAGTSGLTKSDLGTLVLNGTNTYSGSTTINGGTLEVANNSALGSDGVTVDNTGNQGATLKVDSGITLANTIAINNGGTLDNAGTISHTGATEVGVNATGGMATVTNHDGGNIAGGVIGLWLHTGGTVVNTGNTSRIDGAGYALVTDGSPDSMVTNENGASIHGGTQDSVLMIQGGTLINQSGASISGDSVAMRMSQSGTIINQSGASISGTGTSSYGVILHQGGTITNQSGATIQGGDSAIALAGASTITNAAGSSIIGGNTSVSVFGSGTVSLTNAGVLSGSVYLNSGDANAVTLISGSTLTGSLYIGSNTGSQLTLDGNGIQLYSTTVTGTTSFAGTLTKQGAGSWIVDSDLAPANTVISTGTLQIGKGGSTGSLAGNITNNAALVFNLSGASTLAGVISGSGSFTQSGTGVLTLSGANTYGGGTTISAGTLQGDTSSLQGNIANNGTLAFNQNTVGTFAGVISGGGALVQQGSSTLTLDGNSSGFTGSTDVQSGSLIVGSVAGNGAALGGSVVVDNGATLGGHGGIGGNISVAGGAHLASGNSIGTLTIGGNASFAQGSVLDYEFGAPGADFSTFGAGDNVAIGGNLTLNGAVLNISDAGGMGPGLYNLFSYGGTLTETNGGITLGTSPGGNYTIQNLTANKQINLLDTTGLTLNLWNGNGLAGATQMGGGSGTWTTTSPNWTDTTGSVSTAMQPQPTFAIFGGAPGTVTVDNGAGNVSATGMQFASNGYTLAGGTLSLVGSSGNAPIIRVGDGSAAGATYTATINNVIAGTSGLTKSDLGTLVLTGANTYSGDTSINAGTLQGDSSSLKGNIADNAILVFNQATAGIYAGAISGTGVLSKTGTGTLTFNGSSPFSGATTVTSGKLVVGDDSHAGANLGGVVTVASGATLGGIGTIGGLNLAGTVTPGNSIGTLHVTGDATFQQGSSYQIEAAPNGSSDQIVATGKVTILGGSAVVLAQAGNWAPRTDYTIITGAQGVSGQFASTSSSLLFLDPVLSYTANAVNLSLQRNDISFASVAQTPNQLAVATTTNGLGFVSPMYSALTTLDAPTSRHAFDQLSGVIYASTSTALVDDSRYVREAINRHLLGLNGGTEGTTAQGVNVWANVWGHGGHHDDNGNAASLRANGSGLLVGADLSLGGDSRLGAVVGHGQNSIRENSLGSSAHVLGDHVGLYGSSSFGAFMLRGGIAYARQDVHSNRAVAFGSYNDWLSSEHHAQTAQAYVEGGYQFNVSPGQQLEPFVNVARVRVHSDALQEGGGNAALAVAGNSASVNTATLGLRNTLTLDAAGGIHAHASLGYQRAWGDLTPVTTTRFVTGGNSFAVAGMPVARHAFTTDLGIDFKLARNVSVDASYLGQFASGVQDQGARMSLTVTF